MMVMLYMFRHNSCRNKAAATCVSHFIFKPLLHRARYTWYSCVRKGAVYLHIIHDVYYAVYHYAAIFLGRTKQHPALFYRVLVQTFGFVYAARAYISTEHTRKGSSKISSTYATTFILQSVLCAQLAVLLAASSSRGGTKYLFVNVRQAAGLFVSVHCRQTRRRAAAQTQQQPLELRINSIHTAVREQYQQSLHERAADQAEPNYFSFVLYGRKTDANKNVQLANY